MPSTGAKPLARADRPGPTGSAETMSAVHALSVLSALGQLTRLAIFRLLLWRGPEGLVAGGIAEAVGCPPNTVSSHLSILARAGLINGTREGRTIVYRADFATMRALVAFLVDDCCDGHPEVCDLETPVGSALCGCAQDREDQARRNRSATTSVLRPANGVPERANAKPFVHRKTGERAPLSTTRAKTQCT